MADTDPAGAFVQGLKNAEPFKVGVYEAYLGNATSSHSTMSLFNGFLHNKQPEKKPDNEVSAFISSLSAPPGKSIDKAISDLAMGTLALGVSRMDDGWGFHDCAKAHSGRDLAQAAMTDLIPSLYGKHLDEQLAIAQAESLQNFAADITKVQAFQDLLMSPSFIRSVKRTMQQNQRTTYRTNLLFANEYIKIKGVPSISTPTAPASGLTPMSIVQKWAEHTPLHDTAPANEKDDITLAEALRQNMPANLSDISKLVPVAQGFAELAVSLSAVYNPSENLTGSIASYVMPVLQAVWPEINDHLPTDSGSFVTQIDTLLKSQTQSPDHPAINLGSLAKDLKPFLTHLWQDWDPQVEIVRVVGNQLAGFYGTATYGGTRHYYYGDNLKGVMTRDGTYSNQLFDLGRLHNTREENEIFGCFIPGTKVLTQHGEISIENLSEGDRVVTRLQPRQYGVCSDEVVSNPVYGSTLLCGFNSESPWFTPGHVFFTTTGIRAIDPAAAIRENPWLEVGTLSRGHVLFRANEDGTYNRVEIETINSAVVECSSVHGVHLREGLRSYHANGYLVHLNYPEITIKSVARLLRRLPAQLRLSLLLKFKELAPLFGRFGTTTVAELIDREMADDELLAQMRMRPADMEITLALKYQTRSFELSPSGLNRLEFGSAADLPTVDVYDGVLFLNGVYCEHAQIGTRKVSWFRNMGDYWQFGAMNFGDDHKMLCGSGYIVHSQSQQPTDTKHRLNFRATSIALRSPEEASQEVAVPPTDSSFAAEETKISDTKADDTTGDMAPQPAAMAMMSSEVSEKAADDTSAVDDIPDCGEWPQKSPTVTTRPMEMYTLVYDDSEFDASATPLKQEKALFDVAYANVGSTDGINSYTFTVPALDAIFAARREANAANGADKIEDVQYYASEVYQNEKNNTVCVIRMKNPDLLFMASDQYTGADDEKMVYLDLTFQKANSTLKLPFVFSGLCFTLDYKDDKITRGLIRTYDPDMDGTFGTRYRLGGGRQNKAANTHRRMAAMVVSDAAPPGQAHVTPKAFASGDLDLDNPVALTPDDLATFDIDDDRVKKDSQDMLHLAMLYHMDSDDRINFFDKKNPPPVGNDVNSPEKVPKELASELPKNLKDWLRNTYANAYLALNWSRQDKDTQKKAKAEFTDQDVARIEYWWKGKSNSCLAQQEEYKQLNRVAAMLALRRQSPRVMDYINDAAELEDNDPIFTTYPDLKARVGDLRGLGGGEKWAKIFYFFAIEQKFVESVRQKLKTSPQSLNNPLTRHCTVLQCLHPMTTADPEKKPENIPLDLRYAALVKRWIKADQADLGTCIADIADLQDSGVNAFHDWVLMILKDQDSFEDTLHKQLKEDLTEIDKFLNGQTTGQIANAELIAGRMVGALRDSVRQCLTFGTTDLAQNGVQKLLQRFANAPDVQMVNRWMGTLNFSMSMISAGIYVFDTLDAWKEFRDLPATQKAQMRLSVAQAATGLGLGIYTAVRLWRGKDVSELRIRAEIRRAATKNIERALQARATENVVPFQRPVGRRNSIAIGLREKAAMDAERVEALAGVPRRRAVTVEAAVFEHDAPTPYKSISPSEEEVTLKSDLKGLKNYNVGWRILAGIAAVLSLALLVVACIAVAKAWADLDTGESVLQVFSLVHQMAMLILEIVCIFVAVTIWATVALLIIGLIIALAYWLYEKFKPPRRGPIESWRNDRAGRFFVDKLTAPPLSAYSWKMEPGSSAQGTDTTIKLIGTAQDRSKGIDRLQSVFINFSVGKDQNSTLFNLGDDDKMTKKKPDKSLELNNVDFEMAADLKSKVNASCLPTGAGLTTLTSYNMIVQAKPPSPAPPKTTTPAAPGGGGPGPVIPPTTTEAPKFNVMDVVSGTTLTFILRGKISPAPAKDPKGYSFMITEQYVDKKGFSSESIEIEQIFKKQ